MAYVSSTAQLLAQATAPKGKFWITDGMRRAAARDLAERADELESVADRLAAAELFRQFPRECQEAVPVLRAWLRPVATRRESASGGSAGAEPTPRERRTLAALHAGAAQALSAIGAPAVEALADLRAARAVERDDRARAALDSAIDRLERLAPAG